MLISSGEIFQSKDKVSVKPSEIGKDLPYCTIRRSDQDLHTPQQILTFIRKLSKILTHFCFAFSGNPRYFLINSFLQTTLISSGERMILTKSVKDLNREDHDVVSSLILIFKFLNTYLSTLNWFSCNSWSFAWSEAYFCTEEYNTPGETLGTALPPSISMYPFRFKFWWSETWHYDTILKSIFLIRLKVASWLPIPWRSFLLLLSASWVKHERISWIQDPYRS